MSDTDPSARPAAIEAALAQWVSDCVHNSPLARDTDAYNHLVQTALPELARRIQEIA